MGVIQKNIIIHFLLAANLLRIPYPEVRRDSTVIDDYHGTKVADPYRWLEDIDSKDTQEFVQEQQKLTQSFLKEIPSRDAIRDRLTSVWNYPKSTVPYKVGKKYYTLENTGLQNQSIMYVQDNLLAASKVFLDPNKFSVDGTVALDVDSYAFTKDGELFAYATTQSGSDWKEIRFLNVSTGQTLPDVLKVSKWPGFDWSNDGLGVFYTRYPSPNDTEGGSGVTENSRIYYHRIGTAQAEDILIAEFPRFPKRSLNAAVTECGCYLIITGAEVLKANSVHVASLKNGINENIKNQLVPVFPSGTQAFYSYIANEGSTFLFLTSQDAPNYKLITINIDTTLATKSENADDSEIGQFSFLSTFLKEDPKKVIKWATVINTNYILVCYWDDVKNTLELRSLRNDSFVQKIDLPPGFISGFSSENKRDTEFFFVLTNLLSPGTIYQCQVEDSVKCTILKQTAVAGTDLSAFVTEQVFYPSKDGTRIPMFILRKKNVPLDGTAPTLLYGYGGFNSVLLPRYSSSNLVFVENFNGIYVSANIRGGGEYGEKWHEAGSLLNKQNVFDDFQAAAEYLIKNNYTSSSKLAIQGGLNGGLLVAACVNQRPDLFGAAIAQVGVMDMLRVQKFTIGHAWCAEYGCSDNKEYFENLIKYSPLHNIRFPTEENVQYPAVLVTTADHDDRVVPAHSYKYIAELQHNIGRNPKQTNPLLLRVDVKAGHGAGKPTSKKIDEVTDTYAFLAETLGLTFTSNEQQNTNI